MGANNLEITLVMKDKFSQDMQRAKTGILQMQKSLKDTGTEGVSSVTAIGGAFRTMEGTIPIRALERFISQSKLATAAFQAVFPVVGAVALVGVLARMGEEFQKTIDHAKNLATNITSGFESLRASSQLANDELALTNQKLEDQIAKISGKPENRLKDALLEARVEADKLYDSLRKDSQEMAKLLEANKVSFFDQVLGKGSDKDVAGNATNFENQSTKLGGNYADAVRQHGEDSPEAKQAKAAITQLFDNIDAYVKTESAKRTGKVTTGMQNLGRNGQVGGATVDFAAINGDQSGNLAILQGLKSMTDQRRDNMGLQDANATDKKNLGAAQDNKAAQEAYDKALKARLEFRDKMTKAYEQMGIKDSEELEKDSNLLDKFNPTLPGMKEFKPDEKDNGIADAIKANDELADIARRGADALQEEQIKMAAANGTISKHAEALAMAAILIYAEERQLLCDILQFVFA